MSNSGQYLLNLFVSAPEAIRPFYKRDILNLCCLPTGDRMTLAFKEKWIATSVLDHVKSGAPLMAGWRALVIFCEELKSAAGAEERKNTAGDVYCFHPIREAKVLRAVSGNGGVTFELELGNFLVLGGHSVAQVHASIAAQAEEHPNYPRIAENVPDKRAKFVRCAQDSLNLQAQRDGWDGLVARISTLRGLKDALFFSLTDKSGMQYPHFPFERTNAPSDMRPEFQLTRGTEVQLNLHAIAGSDTDFSPPEIKASDSVIGVSGPFVRQYLSGYAVTYYLQVKAGWDSDSTMLSVALPAKSPENAIRFRSPEISIHLRIKPRAAMTVVVVALLTFGTLLSSLDKDTLAVFNIAASWSLVAKTLGPVLFAIGAFLGFRTLPGA